MGNVKYCNKCSKIMTFMPYEMEYDLIAKMRCVKCGSELDV